jgi:Mrp family chromosome partitioning ATPase
MGIPDMKPEKPSRDMTSLIERASSRYGLSASSEPRARKRLDVPLIPEPDVAAVEAVSQAPVEQALPEVQPQAVQEPAPIKATPSLAQAAGTAEINLQRLADLGFIVPGHPPTALSEEFRIVKRPLLLNAFGGRSTPSVDRGRAILVCSAHPNEGKTFCSINLAMSLVNERNVEVVLVDADVAKPEILSSLGVTGAAGLLDAIVQDVDPETLIIPTTIPGLSVLPAGHQTPARSRSARSDADARSSRTVR